MLNQNQRSRDGFLEEVINEPSRLKPRKAEDDIRKRLYLDITLFLNY